MNVELRQGISYADSSPRQTLDLYLPGGSGGGTRPLIVMIHGGAFKYGDSRSQEPFARAAVEAGFAAAAVNYRRSGEGRYPAGAQDVKAAVRWLRAHAGELQLDPSAFAAWGQSAGGWMALMLGVTGDQRTLFDDPHLGNPEQSSAVQAVVAWYPPTDFATMDTDAAHLPAEAAQPLVHDDPESPESLWLGEPVTTSELTSSTNLAGYLATATVLPPFYLAHGEIDHIVAPGQSRRFAEQVAAVGGTVELTTVAATGHAEPEFDAAQVDPSLAFTRRALNR